ncbi:MAG: hypothetical protein Q8878_01645 [Bacillota bacterium]|nr:hypothetical protein [Bacillota bacterium]
MRKEDDGMFRLFMKTGLPEAYTAYSALNGSSDVKGRGKRRGK